MPKGRQPPRHDGTVALRTSDARSAGKGAVTLAVLQSAGRIFALAFVMTATRAVAPSAFGRYSTAAAILVIVGFVSDLGTTAAMTKLVSTGGDADALVANSLCACLGLGLFAWMVGEAAVLVAYRGAMVLDFAILGASLPIDACLSTLVGALDGAGAISRRAVVSFARIGLGALAAAALVATTASIRWAMAGLVIGPAVGLVLAVYHAKALGVWSGHLSLDPRKGKGLLIAAAPFAMIGGVSVLSARIDVVTVSLVSSRATTAAYDVAIRVLEGPLFISTVLAGPMLFLFSRRLRGRDTHGVQRAFDQVADVLLVLGVLLSVLLVTLAGPLVRVAFGDGYAKSTDILAIVGAQLWLMLLCGLQGTVMAAMPRMRKVVTTVGLVALTQVLLQVTLIVVAGPVGGALSYSFQSVATAIAYGAFIRQEVGVRTVKLPQVRCVMAAASAALIALALRTFPVGVPALAAATTYLVCIVGLRVVTVQQLSGLREILRRD